MMTCLCIKAKWATLKSWIVPSSSILLHRRRKQRQKNEQQQQQQQQQPEMYEPHRRPSHCTSCSTSPSDLRDETPTMSFCKRRSSQSSQTPDLQRETEKVYDLYVLAMDELNYAGDSQGTLYYVNDRESAQEAIENFSNASMQLLTITHDPDSRSQLQTMIQSRLHNLQTKFNALPEEDPLNYRRSTYCSS